MIRRDLLQALATLAGLASLEALAQATPASAPPAAPRGRVVLSVSGRIRERNAEGRFEFDMAMLEALPQHSFTTRTPWYPEARRFTGPLLRDVLAAVGADGRTLRAIALNDYKVTVPIEDSRRFEVVLARLMDGKPMPVRDKGPLFIVYPYDSDEALRSELYYSRSAWQLKSLEVE